MRASWMNARISALYCSGQSLLQADAGHAGFDKQAFRIGMENAHNSSKVQAAEKSNVVLIWKAGAIDTLPDMPKVERRNERWTCPARNTVPFNSEHHTAG